MQSTAPARVCSAFLFFVRFAPAGPKVEEETYFDMSKSSSILLEPPEYHPDLFVDRVDEIQRVVALARAPAAGSPVSQRTVIFRGERGCGKTWLLRHLAEDAYTRPADSQASLNSSCDRMTFGAS